MYLCKVFGEIAGFRLYEEENSFAIVQQRRFEKEFKQWTESCSSRRSQHRLKEGEEVVREGSIAQELLQ